MAKVSGKTKKQFSLDMGKCAHYASAAARERWSDIGCDSLARAAAAAGWELRLVDPSTREYVTIGDAAPSMSHPVTSGIELPQDANYMIG
jgi:hypothetical protein